MFHRLFLLEGAFTFLIGVASWILLPASISQTAGRGRGKGWFSEREEKILVNRLLRDDPSKGDMHNRQAVGPVRLWKCLKDYDLWPLYMVSIEFLAPCLDTKLFLAWLNDFYPRESASELFDIYSEANGIQYLSSKPDDHPVPIHLRRSGESLCYPYSLSQNKPTIQLLVISWVSERFNERALISSLSNVWFSLASRPCCSWDKRVKLGSLCHIDRIALIPILSCDSRGVEFAQFQFRPAAGGFCGTVQHVRSGREHCWVEYLSRRRSALLRHREQGAAGAQLLQSPTLRVCQILLHQAQRATATSMGRAHRGGKG